MSLDRLRTVVIVSDSARIDGGLGKVALTSALELRALGLDVIYFCPVSAADARLAAAGVRLVTLDQTFPFDDPKKLRGMMRGLWNRSAARALAEVLAGCDPASTIVHCHGFSKALSPAIGPVLTGGACPVVYTMHEFFLACPNGGFFDFQRQEICTRKPLGLSCLTTHCDSRSRAIKGYRVLRQAILHGPGRLPRKLRDVIAISKTCEAVMAPLLPSATQIYHVPNPVNRIAGPRVAVEKNDTFLFVGRLEPDKGALAFAQAAHHAGANAVFVGSGSQSEKIAQILPQAIMPGWQTPEQVFDWIGRARALVFPSLWQETFGLSAYEALGRGVPVITGAWTAAHEVVEHGKTGLIYQTPDALAEALSQMTPERAGQMSRRAYDQRASYGLTAQEHAARLIEVYSSILSR